MRVPCPKSGAIGRREEVEVMKVPKIGDVVQYVDPLGKAHFALVTAVWPSYAQEPYNKPGLNIVFVVDDEATDRARHVGVACVGSAGARSVLAVGGRNRVVGWARDWCRGGAGTGVPIRGGRIG